MPAEVSAMTPTLVRLTGLRRLRARGSLVPVAISRRP